MPTQNKCNPSNKRHKSFLDPGSNSVRKELNKYFLFTSSILCYAHPISLFIFFPTIFTLLNPYLTPIFFLSLDIQRRLLGFFKEDNPNIHIKNLLVFKSKRGVFNWDFKEF